MCPHTTCVLMLLYMFPHTTIYVSSYYCIQAEIPAPPHAILPSSIKAKNATRTNQPDGWGGSRSVDLVVGGGGLRDPHAEEMGVNREVGGEESGGGERGKGRERERWEEEQGEQEEQGRGREGRGEEEWEGRGEGRQGSATIVTAYYEVPSKFAAHVYLEWMRNMLLYITSPIVIYTDARGRRTILEVKKQNACGLKLLSYSCMRP